MSKVVFDLPDDWRGQVMSKIRQLIAKADKDILEDVKYKTASNPNGVLVWYKNGMLLTGEVYKKHLRLSFTKGVALKAYDLKGLINSYRAMLIKEENQALDESAFSALIHSAVKLNQKS